MPATEIPYETLDLHRTAEEARRAERLRGIYHAAQDLARDGREVLPALIAGHGGVRVQPRVRDAIGRIFSVIMWGCALSAPPARIERVRDGVAAGAETD